MYINSVKFPSYKTKEENYNQKEKLIKNDLFRKSMEDAYDFTDEEKSQLNSSIMTKMRTGAKFTQKELRYLQKTNPQLYMKILMIQKRREILEQKLKNCKSKKEVNDAITFELSSIRKSDPDKELKIRSIQDTEREFKKTTEYRRLPATNEGAEKEKKLQTKKQNNIK